MYRCQICGTMVPPKTKSRLVVLETREKAYAPQMRPERGKPKGGKGGSGGGRGRGRRDGEDPGGRGWEIAKEALACNTCADRHESEKAES